MGTLAPEIALIGESKPSMGAPSGRIQALHGGPFWENPSAPWRPLLGESKRSMGAPSGSSPEKPHIALGGESAWGALVRSDQSENRLVY